MGLRPADGSRRGSAHRGPDANRLQVHTQGTHGYPFHALPDDALPNGWKETEYFVEGNTFTTATPLPFKTRMLVVRPKDAKLFNGKVIVEWMNVSGGMDLAVDRAAVMSLVLDEGYAFVGVTAQKIGVDFLGHTGNPSVPVFGDDTRISARRGTPNATGRWIHPGDDPGSFDIFSEVGKVLRDPGSVDPLAGLAVISSSRSVSHSRLGAWGATPRRIHNVTTAPVYDAFVLNVGPMAPNANLPTITVNSEREAGTRGLRTRRPTTRTGGCGKSRVQRTRRSSPWISSRRC